MTKATEKKEKKVVAPKVSATEDHVVTAEDMENNPNLAEQGIVVGDVIEVPKKATGKANRVVFELKNNGRREFTKEIHGDNFLAVAKEFSVTNANIILSRVDL